MLSVLFLGDIVGEPGRNAVMERLPELKKKYTLDFVVANGENAAAGRGITGKITIDLLRAGVSVVTTGDHIWDQRDIPSFLELEPRLLRPLNYPPGAPGAGTLLCSRQPREKSASSMCRRARSCSRSSKIPSSRSMRR